MSNIANRAMLASLRISTWSGRKYDRKVSVEVAQQHATSVDAGRYHKKLAHGAATLEAIRSIAGAARNTHAALTLPWTNDGERILPTRGYLKWANEMRKAKDEMSALVEVFVGEYEQVKQADRQALNGLYNEADYPADIRACFSFDTFIKPLPEAGDFRVELAEGEVTELKRQLTETIQSSVETAQKDAVGRLYRAVAHMADRLRDPEAKFHNTLVENVRELCELLPGFNLTEDSTLEKLVKDARSMVSGLNAEDIRVDPRLRQGVVYDAEQIVNQMQGVWGVLGK